MRHAMMAIGLILFTGAGATACMFAMGSLLAACR